MIRTLEWHLRRRMAERDIFKTTELGPLLAARGVQLSREQVYRLVTSPPKRLNMDVLGALCDILGCTPNDLITFEAVAVKPVREATGGTAVDLGSVGPVPAKIVRPDRS